MQKREKIIILGLIILIIGLLVGLTTILINNNSFFDNDKVLDGMQKYDFNSIFKMDVPKNVRFLKEWNNTEEFSFGDSYTYLDKKNKFAVSYADSPIITHELVNSFLESQNKSGNITFKYDNDMIIAHNKKNNGKIGKTFENCYFKERIIVQKGHTIIFIYGNDLDFIKSMADTIEFYQ